MILSRSELDSAHAWFQRRGVPLAIPAKERLLMMMPHSVPVTVWFILSALCSAVLWDFLVYLDSGTSENPGQSLGLTIDQFFLLALGFTSLTPFFLLFIPLLLRRFFQRLPQKVQHGLGLFFMLLALYIYSPLYASFRESLVDSWWQFFGFFIFLILVLFLQLDSLLFWAAQQTLRELLMLMPMVAKVLPTLMIAVLFIFVNGDIWKVAKNLTLTNTLGVFGVLFTLAFFVTVTTAFERTRRLLGTKSGNLENFELDEYHAAAQTAGVPWPALVQRADTSKLTVSRKISWAEWINFITLPVLSQMIQALIFALIVFIFFLWFGGFAIPHDTVVSWLGSQPESLSISGLTIPISAVLVKVSGLLAGFASLNFVASTAVDRRYFSEFLEPMITYLREVIIIRDLYLVVRN